MMRHTSAARLVLAIALAAALLGVAAAKPPANLMIFNPKPAPNSVSVAVSPAGDLVQAIVTLSKCTTLAAHNHPGASETAYVLNGQMLMGVVLDGGKLVTATVKAGQSFYFPRGLIHFQYNPTCKPAAFLATLPSGTPGTVFIAPALLGLPFPVLDAQLLSKKGCPWPKFAGVFSANKACLKTCK